jgi:glyceraldehyde-3-phosphate dehydrogenase (NADP+)
MPNHSARPTRTIINPYDGTVAGECPVSTLADAENALAKAVETFTLTRQMSTEKRYNILRAIEAGIQSRRDEFARTITRESGKTIANSYVEVDRAILVFSLAAEEARRLGGELLPLDLNPASVGRFGITRRFPVGVVGAITPFNFPLNLVAHKVAPAIAVGNPLLLKPAEKTPLTALLLAEVIGTTDLPDGAFAVLTPETPQEIGNLFATDKRIRILSFTGADRVGWELKGKANRKRVLLELGGNAGVVIEPDAAIEFAVARCAMGSFTNAGQVCISVQRILVQESIYPEFVEAFIARVRAMRVGDPTDPDTEIGPMINETACDTAEQRIHQAIQAGATALLHGERRSKTLLTPTILTHTTPEMPVCAEEIFAPVVVIEPYSDFDAALTQLNNSRFGLQAGIFTQDMGKIFRAFEHLEVGSVIINDVPTYRIDNMPYGGEKDSGFGREGIRYAIEEMTAIRLLAINLKQ